MDTQLLGGNIELIGFREIDPSSLIVFKKILGNYARKFRDRCDGFEKLSLRVKTVHATENSVKYELRTTLVNDGRVYASALTDRNLFFVLDKGLKKIENEIFR
jgi:hypothetical protein